MICLALELILGFCGADNNRIYGFAFIAVMIVAIVFQIASASQMVESVDGAGGSEQDNLNAHYFFLYASPIAPRTLSTIMKYLDIRGGAAASGSESA